MEKEIGKDKDSEVVRIMETDPCTPEDHENEPEMMANDLSIEMDGGNEHPKDEEMDKDTRHEKDNGNQDKDMETDTCAPMDSETDEPREYVISFPRGVNIGQLAQLTFGKRYELTGSKQTSVQATPEMKDESTQTEKNDSAKERRMPTKKCNVCNLVVVSNKLPRHLRVAHKITNPGQLKECSIISRRIPECCKSR